MRQAILRVEAAVKRCRCTLHEFFSLAELAGSPRAGYILEPAVARFDRVKNNMVPVSKEDVPKHVIAFADKVLAGQCPGKCGKACLRPA